MPRKVSELLKIKDEFVGPFVMCSDNLRLLEQDRHFEKCPCFASRLESFEPIHATSMVPTPNLPTFSSPPFAKVR